MRMSFIAFVSY